MNKSVIKIFTEGGYDIGLGHITRCCSLYDEITSRGYDVTFYIKGETSKIKQLESYRVVNTDWLNIEYLENQISSEDYCIIDSYLADKSLYDFIANRAKKVLYIDDMNRIDYPKGIVVNPSLSLGAIKYSEKRECKYLWGPDYVVLRGAFTNYVRDQVNDSVKRVLITMGGIDFRNLTRIILNEICYKYTEIEFDVVIASTNSNLKSIRNLNGENIKFHYDLNETAMKDLMVNADFAITSAGQTIYELLATKTPFIPIQTACNQTNNINSLFELELTNCSLHYSSRTLRKELNENFNMLIDCRTRLKLIKNYEKLIDGKGSMRIINELINEDANMIHYRRIVAEDCDLLYKWANDQLVRKNAFNTEEIDYESHKKWFQSKLNSNTTIIYIALIKSLPIGQIRIDIEAQNGIIDYSIDSQFRNRGLGTVLLKTISSQVIEDYPLLNKLIGRVKKDNIPSQKAFEKAMYNKKIEQTYYEYEFSLMTIFNYKNKKQYSKN
jgi:UDP-2,4-diacetamido-2,4,6-trideoxy-beta-L-altropyranose hydrolase